MEMLLNTRVQLRVIHLSFMTGRVNQYELHANDAVKSIHEAAKEYHPTYRPQVENSEKKIKSACAKVLNAVAEAQLKLGLPPAVGN
jgi:tRNA splicing ligase